jgi:hypothetical protein
MASFLKPELLGSLSIVPSEGIVESRAFRTCILYDVAGGTASLLSKVGYASVGSLRVYRR